MTDLSGMEMFVAVGEAKGFRAAGERLGVSAAAVSQALRRLEERLGVVLVQRTTRSVHLTDAGEQLFAEVRPALEQVRAAATAASELSHQPRGTLRILMSSGAEHILRDELLGGFLTAHPHIRLDLDVSNEIADIVATGYDAGIQLGEVIDRDMIAVAVSSELRLIVVGAPLYFARRPKPKHPRDLVQHDCINWHSRPDARPYRWEFTENGRDFSVAVPMRVLTTDPALLVRLACAGVGLAMVYEDQVRAELARGDLVAVLEQFVTPFPGFFLYYPHRRHASAALRALVEYVRASRRGKGGGKRSRARV